MEDKPVILVVDDQPQNIKLLEQYLVPQGYEIVKAANGEEALEKLSGNQIDLILLDVIMPGMDGFEVTRRVRQDNIHRLLPIILVTALREKEDRVKGIEAGCNDFISKPIYLMELLARVRSLLKIKAYNDLMSNYRKDLESEVTSRTEELKQALENLQQNITERMKTEEELREASAYNRSLIEASIDPFVTISPDGKITDANAATERVTGYTRDVLIGTDFSSYFSDPEVASIGYRQAFTEGHVRDYMLEICHCDGHVTPVLYNAALYHNAKGEVSGIFAAARDITESKWLEEELLRTNILLNSIVENIPNMVFLKDAKELRFVLFNRAGEDLLGHSRNDLLGKNDYDFFPKEQADFFTEKDREVMHGKEVVDIPEEPIQTRKKGERILHTKKVPILNAEGEPQYLLGISEDITERKRAEEALRESALRLHSIIGGSPIPAFVIGKDHRVINWNKALAEMSRIRSEEIVGTRGQWKAFYNEETPCMADLLLDEAIELVPQWYSGKYIKSSFIEDAYQATDFFPALGEDGKWLRSTAASIRDSKGMIVAAIETLEDITERKHAEQKLESTLESLRKAFGAIVQVLVSAVETRDPYTSGHQIRSADLARAIATEMGLPRERIEGIRMAGSIHDIGKMSVPAEILSRPTKLTELEFSLIKEHANKGFEMLKNVESPWPLAEIVYQHHERMNGSGYPRGLKGDEIIMEARILAVADVVESMASHRPYRPTLGSNAALAEIENNKGTLYDADVVDACLRLFREKGFQLEGTRL